VPDDPAKDPWATVEQLRSLPARRNSVLGVRRSMGARSRDSQDAAVRHDRLGSTEDRAARRAELAFAGAPGMN